MNIKRLTLSSLLAVTVSLTIPAMASCSNQVQKSETSTTQDSLRPKGKGGKPGGPQLGTPGGGPVIDKSGDETLQAMIKTEVPEFKQYEYTDAETGKTIKYNLFTPKNIDSSEKYPLILFMADANPVQM